MLLGLRYILVLCDIAVCIPHVLFGRSTASFESSLLATMFKTAWTPVGAEPTGAAALDALVKRRLPQSYVQSFGLNLISGMGLVQVCHR